MKAEEGRRGDEGTGRRGECERQDARYLVHPHPVAPSPSLPIFPLTAQFSFGKTIRCGTNSSTTFQAPCRSPDSKRISEPLPTEENCSGSASRTCRMTSSTVRRGNVTHSSSESR